MDRISRFLPKMRPLRAEPALSMLAGGALAVIYGAMAIDSNHGTGMDVFVFIQMYSLAALIVFAFYALLATARLNITFKTVFIWAVIFRIIAVAGSPILEDDFHRYLLDGCVFVTSGSPYGIAPSTLFAGNELSPECQDALNWVNNPDLPTIYGPLLQYVFALAYLISPADIDFLQILLAGTDLVLVWMLGKVAPARHVMLFAWCPLIVKETAFTTHPDVIGVTLLFAAFLLRSHGRSLSATMVATLACCAKVFALLALPFFLYRKGPAHWIGALSVALLLYLPFILQGHTDMFVLGVFARDWDFNPILFEVARTVLSDTPARIVCLSLFALWWCHHFYRHFSRDGFSSATIPRMDWIFGVFLLLSPVINAWYLVWLLPFAVLRPTFVAWTASLAVVLSYVTGLNLLSADLSAYEVHDLAHAAEILLIALALLADLLFNRSGIAGREHRLSSRDKT